MHGCNCNKFFDELLANSGSPMSRGLENAGCMKAIAAGELEIKSHGSSDAIAAELPSSFHYDGFHEHRAFPERAVLMAKRP